MGMSEPSGGTDVLGLKSTLTKCPDKDDHFRLTGSKMWITNGSDGQGNLNDAFLVYCKPDQTLLPNAGKGALSMVIVEKGMEGFTLGQDIKGKCGMRASPTTELSFDNVCIPKENLVGEMGQAAICMMRNLEIERLVLAAMGLGVAQRSIEEMVKYSQERHAFGKPLKEFGQIQRFIGKSFAEYQAGMAYVYTTASQLKLDQAGNRLDSDGVKLYCANMAKTVSDRAMQVLGGNGYVDDYVVERLWRDAKLGEIGGGTNESHHKNITGDLARLDPSHHFFN
jgi:isovaleryl-CoA dehydrogenase